MMMASRFITPFGNRGLLRDPLLELNREVNRLFDDSFRTIREGGGGAMIAPKIDICPVDNGWEVTAELPGVDEKDIDLRLDGDMLTISGEKRDERKDDKNRLVERDYGAFTRSFQLPFNPDPDKVTADCKNGVLTIKLPKSAEQDRSKRIAIGGAGKSDQPAIGKDWTKDEEAKTSDLAKERAEKGQGAPA
jgi:HSP20 family protein